MSVAGAAMFARFAAPPNRHGYCGPDAYDRLVAYGTGGLEPDRGLRELATAFEGAWPWLELLAGAERCDPLDARVIEAYWIGNDLLTRVPAFDLGNHLAGRFAARSSPRGDPIVAAVGAGAQANHAFHVFGVYPWVGLLREGRAAEIALPVLDNCRVSWGRIVATGAIPVVERRPLTWDGATLALGAPERRAVANGLGASAAVPAIGDVVALHWDTICHRLEPRTLRWLGSVTTSQLALANATGLGDLVSPG